MSSKRIYTDPKIVPILAIDFETSGWVHEKGQPVEFAAVLVDPITLKPMDRKDNTFHCYFKMVSPYKMIPSAFKTHKLTEEFLEKNGRTFYRNADDFYTWLRVHGFDITKENVLKLLGQNLSFDIDFLHMWLGGQFCREFFHYHTLDTMHIADFINKGFELVFGFDSIPFRDPIKGYASVSLDAQCHAYEYKNTQAHSAVGDVFATIEMYRNHIHNFAEDLARSQQNAG